MSSAKPRIVPPFMAALVFTDPTPAAIVNNRIAKRAIEIAQKYTDLTESEQSEFFDIVLLTARKMVMVWKHLDKYVKEEDRLIAEFEKAGLAHVDYGQTLFEEFDGFAVQIKSTLDHVVKAMRPMVGAKCWTIRTFGEHGDQVVQMLDRSVPKKYEFKVRVMKSQVFNETRMAWLDAIIGARDRVNHLQDGGIPIKNFSVLRRPDGVIEVPRWSNEQKLRDAMTGLWNEFFFLVEDFIMCSLHFRLREGLQMMRKPEHISSPSSCWSILSADVAAALVKKLSAGQRPTVI